MKLLQILNEIEVRNIRFYTITVSITDEDTGEVIGNKKVLVYPEDLGKMNWDEATKACKKLGPGWRLPDKDELKAMYKLLHEQDKGNFEKDWYWSSSQYKLSYAWGVFFSNGYGNSGFNGKGSNSRVRAVRSTT